MDSFDIQTLLRFTPPKFYCPNCFALYASLPTDFERCLVLCEACNVEFIPDESISVYGIPAEFRSKGWSVTFKDAFSHSKDLANIAQYMRPKPKGSFEPSYLPMQGLLAALNAAQQFVHFTTYGMSLQLVGALRMAALRVAVRGIVSNANANIVEELRAHADESPRLKVHLYEQSSKRDDWDNMPHHKVIIVDGLLAFKGSANLTVDGWRKAAKGLDSVEVVTDIKEVIDLNNRLFSPIWAKDSDTKQVVVGDEVPF